MLYGVAFSCLILPTLSVLTTVYHLATTSRPWNPTTSVKLPLWSRWCDLVTLAYFAFNLGLVCYIVDIEQILITNPHDAAEVAAVAWPPQPMISLIHWYAHNYDPVLLARPPWWRATIWVDVLFYGPFYVLASYALIKGANWIRIPAIIYSASILTVLLVILFEETLGDHATPSWDLVMLLNAPWVVLPAMILLRMSLSPLPFSIHANPKSKTS